MPFDWISESAWKQNNREGDWRFGGNRRRTFRCRVVRASAFPSNATTTFWDVVVLGDGDTEIDMKASGQFPSNVLPVRPMLVHVTDSVSASHSAGDVVSVDVDITAGRRKGVVLPGDTAEDYCVAFPGSHKILAGAGGGGCSASFFNLGVYYG